MSLRLLSLDEVQQSITMSQAIKAMENAFIQLAKQHAKLPLRTGITIDEEDALTLTMPAYLAQDKALGLKVASIFPKNSTRNKPSITGFIMLLDATTGEPQALMDASYLTALRTGAVSGLATQYFATDDATHVAIIGSGVQAETQLQAVATVRDIKRVSIWSRNIKNAEQFAAQFANQYTINVYDHISLAVKDADIICTATASTEPLIHLRDVQPHVHINAIGSHTAMMKEISTEVLKQAVVIVDQLSAVMAEAGEIISAVQQNQLKQEEIVELGNWLIDKNTEYKDQLTVFKSVGLSIQDLSVASVVYQNAINKNLGTLFALT
ncbi:ornithine cyclodeaminase family protein [Fluoribacter gormanii]|uniref:Ornithine cyclodeaminase n=1 Tax=Fluoribacter gormanii TaxID=464 RepID=A0A377GNN5_9GAMM|nr:ornithine cyclodeaminase family protein [Fluoribacter gormanii]KTD00523.1 ornithine cyclodeaminase [Fluoribacter gormanii]MCW8445254.1 ornithine cyclodeaminase family protein [Fluoribacter gormanii]MCW8470462.1 ornithine cyclodeaminase family protein [Fluoribacter gormanii]SIR07635.1 ornithine cyclodeaminase [Fluoribacter gormanii]STO26399.1 ornithine cyclodeaminase [Fluoribacter gormanii]